MTLLARSLDSIRNLSSLFGQNGIPERRKDCREATDLKFGYELRYPRFVPPPGCRTPLPSFENEASKVFHERSFSTRFHEPFVPDVRTDIYIHLTFRLILHRIFGQLLSHLSLPSLLIVVPMQKGREAGRILDRLEGDYYSYLSLRFGLDFLGMGILISSGERKRERKIIKNNLINKI